MVVKESARRILIKAVKSMGLMCFVMGMTWDSSMLARQELTQDAMSIDQAQHVIASVKTLINRAEASKNCTGDENHCCFSPIDVSQILGCVRAIKRKIEQCLSLAAHDLSKAGQDSFVIESVARFFVQVCTRLIAIDEQLSLHDTVVCEKLEDLQVGYLTQIEALIEQLVAFTEKQKGEKDAQQQLIENLLKALRNGANLKVEQLTDIEHIIEQLLKFGIESISREVILQGETLDKSLAELTERIQDKQRALNGQIIGLADDVEQTLLKHTRATQDGIKAYGCTTCTKIITIDRSLSKQYADRASDLASNLTAAQDAITKRISSFGAVQAVQKNEDLVKISNSLTSLAVQGRALLEQICVKELTLNGLIQSKLTDTDLGMVLQMTDLMEKICQLRIDIQQQIAANFVNIDSDIAQRANELYQKLNGFRASISQSLVQQFSQFGVSIVVQFDALCEILTRIGTLLTAYQSQVTTQIAVVQAQVSSRMCEKMSELTLRDRQNTNQLITQIANFGSSFMSAFCSRISNMQAASVVKNTIASSRISVAQSQIMQAVCAGVSQLEGKSNTQQQNLCNKLVMLDTSLSAQLNNQLASTYGVITAQAVCLEGDINTLQATIGTKIVNGVAALVTQDVSLINQVNQTFDNLLTDIVLENDGISTKITTLELQFLEELTNVIQELQDKAALVDIGLNITIVAVAAAAAQLAVIALV
jgi:hypothetical protein